MTTEEEQATTTPGTEIAEPREFVLVTTGERLPATRENAAAVILAARESKRRLDDVIRDAEGWLAEESKLHGTKTFHTEYGKVSISGGETTEYDPEMLAEELRKAGCPEERVNEVVHTKPIEYVVDKRVLRQLTGANPAYAEAAERAQSIVEKPLRTTVEAARTQRTPTGGRTT